MKKIDSKDKARTYGQNEKIWYLCMPYSFLNEEHTLDLDAEMGDRGLIIYFRLLMMATASQGVLKLDTRRISPLQRLAGRLQHRYTEDEIAQVLEILDENDMVKIIEGGEEIKFRDVYEMAVEKQRRAAEKRKAEGTAAYEGGETLEDEPEDEQEQPEEIEAEPEETEEERKKREKKEAAKQKKAEEEAAADEMFEAVWKMYPNKDTKSRVKKTRRIALYKIGRETIEQAIKLYISVVETQRAGGFDRNWKGGAAFFNADIDGYIERVQNGETAGQKQKPQAPIVITDRMIDETILQDGLTKANWDDKKAAYVPELQAAIEAALT